MNAYVSLNQDRYPANDLNIDFTKNHYENVYHDFVTFKEKFYGLDKMLGASAVDPLLYKSLYPILVFDVSKQSERITGGVVDITLNAFFSTNTAPGTTAYALMISDRKLKFKSDGTKMSVIY